MNLSDIKNSPQPILEELDNMYEGVLDMPEDAGLEQQLEILTNKMILAKKMLGLANKLKNPDDKKKHRGRVMGILNQVRSALKKVTIKLDTENNPNN